MKIFIIFFVSFLFLASDMPVLMFRATSTAKAEEVIQLARLSRRRSFVRRSSSIAAERERLRALKMQKYFRRVYVSPRSGR